MTSADTTYATTTPALAGTTPQTTGAPEAQSTVTVTSADTTYATTTPVPAGDRRRQLLQVASTPDFCVQVIIDLNRNFQLRNFWCARLLVFVHPCVQKCTC